MINNPAIVAIVLAIFVALAFSGGFAVSHWRDSSEMRRLKNSNAVLWAVVEKCAVDIQPMRNENEE